MLPGETVTILTAGATTTDRYGNVLPDWSLPPVETPWLDVLCEPRPSGEPLQDARNQVTSGYTLYSLTVPNVVPTAAHRIRVRGVDYDVEGDAADWRMGTFRGLVVQTTLTEG
jgi:hypothetical protein